MQYYFREIPKKKHTFVLFDPPPKWVMTHDPLNNQQLTTHVPIAILYSKLHLCQQLGSNLKTSMQPFAQGSTPGPRVNLRHHQDLHV